MRGWLDDLVEVIGHVEGLLLLYLLGRVSVHHLVARDVLLLSLAAVPRLFLLG